MYVLKSTKRERRKRGETVDADEIVHRVFRVVQDHYAIARISINISYRYVKAVNRNKISNCMQPRDKAKLSVLACKFTVTTFSVHGIDAAKNLLREKKLRDEIRHPTLRDLHLAIGFFTRFTCLRCYFRKAGFFVC